MDAKEARMNARKRIGISLASFFHPFWYIPGLGDWWPRMWVCWAVKTARETGYGFLQSLPCRGSEVLIPGGSLPVKYLEPAWRWIDDEGHGSFWTAAKARLRRDPVGPRIEDWLFFPKASMCREGCLLLGCSLECLEGLILHSPEEVENTMGELIEVTQAMMATLEYLRQQRGEEKIPRDKVELAAGPAATPRLLEVSPGLWKTAEEIRGGGACRCSNGLVLDTWHLRRLARDDEVAAAGGFSGWLETLSRDDRIKATLSPGGLLGWWKVSIPILLPHTKLIHVSPRRDDGGEELRKFIRSEPTELAQMIARDRTLGYEGDFVVEASAASFGPHHCTPGKIREMVIGMHGAVLDLITAPPGQFEE